jgi:hypothetical protein
VHPVKHPITAVEVVLRRVRVLPDGLHVLQIFLMVARQHKILFFGFAHESQTSPPTILVIMIRFALRALNESVLSRGAISRVPLFDVFSACASVFGGANFDAAISCQPR